MKRKTCRNKNDALGFCRFLMKESKSWEHAFQIIEEIAHQKFPIKIRDFFRREDLRWWNKDNNLEYPIDNAEGNVVQCEKEVFYFPLISPDKYGKKHSEKELNQNYRLIRSWGVTLPEILRTYGFRCQCIKKSLDSVNTKYTVACGDENVVNSYKRRH